MKNNHKSITVIIVVTGKTGKKITNPPRVARKIKYARGVSK